jgi:hypothetical protein
MPRDVSDLWTFVVELDHDSRMALFAHCVALTVNAVKLPMERKPRAMATADRLAEAVSGECQLPAVLDFPNRPETVRVAPIKRFHLLDFICGHQPFG